MADRKPNHLTNWAIKSAIRAERQRGVSEASSGERRALFDRLKSAFASGDLTVLLDAVEFLRISDEAGDEIPKWLTDALQEAVLVWLKQLPRGRTGNLLQSLRASAEDYARWKGVAWYYSKDKISLTQAFELAAKQREEAVGVTVTAGAVRKSRGVGGYQLRCETPLGGLINGTSVTEASPWPGETAFIAPIVLSRSKRGRLHSGNLPRR